MKVPPFLLGAALVFWGWHTGLWWLGLVLGLLAELPRWISWRWELDLRERWRVADLCSLLFVLAGIYLYLTQPRLGSALLLLIQWAPALLFPLLAVQLYSGRAGVELSVLLMSLRRQGGAEEGQLDLCWVYLLACLLSAAMVPPQSRFYYPLLALLAAWALWPLRPHHRPLWHWGGLFLLAGGLGYALALSVQQAQLELGDIMVEWIAGWLGGSDDPYRATTAIGEVGELKLSERIVLRVRTDRPLPDTLLLRSASYNRYYQESWLAGHDRFQPLTRGQEGWHLPGEGAGKARLRVDINMELDQGRGILPLPAGARLLQGLEGADLQRNGFGALKVLEGPPRAHYRVTYGAAVADLPPDTVDLRLPAGDREALARVAGQLEFDGTDPEHVLARLQAWFWREFRYSLRLRAPPPGRSALEQFLLHRRSGHCEYFASAAVLLLRQAGIPARYARGWSLQEYSPLEQAYVARARHAHAWVLAWVDGGWRDFDPTPPDWGALEAEHRPWWGGIQDILSRMRFLLAGGEEGEEGEEQVPGYLVWLLILLVALLAWRIARHGRSRRHQGRERVAPAVTPFTPIETLLARRGAGRRAGETLAEWLERLERQGEPAASELRPALQLYYCKRFDPVGLDREGERRLDGMLREWLRRQPRNGSWTGCRVCHIFRLVRHNDE